MTESSHFLSVIKNDDVATRCEGILRTLDATCDNIKKLEDLSTIPTHKRFNGIMLDLHSLFKLPTLDRAFLKLYATDLPTLKFVWDYKNDSMMITQTSLDDGKIRDFDEFVKKCKMLPACAIRRERRYTIHLNATLDNNRVNINNISKHGCFVLTTLDSFQFGDEVSVTVKEFSDQTTIPCIIHRRVEWGNKEQAAGIGVEFLSMTETQRSELDGLLEECAKKMEKDLEMGIY
ncbi:MAG: PilZ domain-containing protein [Deltaproteobacteria bacterium]|nr:PilZ domain-containing protein [Deltaproteobacteria bacterium]